MSFFSKVANFISFQNISSMCGFPGKVALANSSSSVAANVIVFDTASGAMIRTFTIPLVAGLPRYVVAMQFFDSTHIGAYDQIGNSYVLDVGSGTVSTGKSLPAPTGATLTTNYVGAHPPSSTWAYKVQAVAPDGLITGVLSAAITNPAVVQAAGLPNNSSDGTPAYNLISFPEVVGAAFYDIYLTHRNLSIFNTVGKLGRIVNVPSATQHYFDYTANGVGSVPGTPSVANAPFFDPATLNGLVQKAQCVAINSASNIGVARSFAGNIAQLGLSAYEEANPIAGATLSSPITCIVKNTSNNFYVGTADSKVYEIDISGNVLTTISLTVSNNFGNAPLLQVSSLVQVGTKLVIATLQGAIFAYDVSGMPSLVDFLWTGNSSYPSILFSNSVNGLVLQSMEGSGQSGNYVSVVDYAMEPCMQVGELSLDTCTNLIDMYIDSATGQACLAVQNGLLFYELNGLVSTQVLARSRGTQKSDVTQRVIRISNSEDYRARVELDSTFPAGSIVTAARFQAIDYSEVSSSGSPECLDIRRFPCRS